jgi:AcrR family transcriptional regulator
MGRVAGLTAADTRARVLDAAAAVFAEQGFEGARVAAIARRAGLSVGAIYNHWDSKAELLAAVAERHSADELTSLLTGAEDAGVLDIVAALGQRLDERPPVAPLLAEVILASRRDPEAARVLVREVQEQEALLADLLRFGQAAGEVVADVDPKVVARYCLMLGLGSLLVRAMELPSTDTGEWGAFIDRLVDGFRAAP